MTSSERRESGGKLQMILEADLCVLWGEVVIVQKQNCLGRVATLTIVNISQATERNRQKF